MLILKKVPLYVEDPRLISSFFSFIFELTPKYVNDLIVIDIDEDSALYFYQKSNHNNELVIKLEEELLNSISQKVSFFAFKNQVSMDIKKSGSVHVVRLNDFVIISFV